MHRKHAAAPVGVGAAGTLSLALVEVGGPGVGLVVVVADLAAPCVLVEDALLRGKTGSSSNSRRGGSDFIDVRPAR